MCCEHRYDGKQLAAKLEYTREELARYRSGSLERILGRNTVPQQAVMHEYFSLFTPKQLDACEIVVESNLTVNHKWVALREYKSANTYVFPMQGNVINLRPLRRGRLRHIGPCSMFRIRRSLVQKV